MIPSKKFFIFSQNKILLQKINERYELPSFFLTDNVATNHFIGNFNGVDCIACENDSFDPLLENEVWVSLKSAMECLSSIWFNVIARAYQIIRWDKNHCYCGKCGNKTLRIQNQFGKYCAQCELQFFPKISPAVITLIQKENKILMARKKEFPPGVYALIAGFVEPGETIEETVHRETYEEVGIFVKNIKYVGSQSWPFPDSLMMAFTAEYESGDIAYHDGEIEHADWYSTDNIPGYPSSSTSIAYKMIADFISASKVSR